MTITRLPKKRKGAEMILGGHKKIKTKDGKVAFLIYFSTCASCEAFVDGTCSSDFSKRDCDVGGLTTEVNGRGISFSNQELFEEFFTNAFGNGGLIFPFFNPETGKMDLLRPCPEEAKDSLGLLVNKINRTEGR